jgi:hypothetical protein
MMSAAVEYAETLERCDQQQRQPAEVIRRQKPKRVAPESLSLNQRRLLLRRVRSVKIFGGTRAALCFLDIKLFDARTNPILGNGHVIFSVRLVYVSVPRF